MWRWRLCVLCGAAMFWVSSSFALVPGIHGCGLHSDPILAFELVKTPGELERLMPAECRSPMLEAQRAALWIDIVRFVPAYLAVLITCLVALGRDLKHASTRGVWVGVLLAVCAGVFDQIENHRLLQIIAHFPGSQADFDVLIPAVRAKFFLLSAAIATIAILIFRRPDWLRWIGLIMGGSAMLSVYALVARPHDVVAFSVPGWLTILVTAIILSFWRPKPGGTAPG